MVSKLLWRNLHIRITILSYPSIPDHHHLEDLEDRQEEYADFDGWVVLVLRRWEEVDEVKVAAQLYSAQCCTRTKHSSSRRLFSSHEPHALKIFYCHAILCKHSALL